MVKNSGQEVVIVQFAKAPILGKVKTRMQPILSELECVDLHKKLTQFVFNTVEVFVSSRPVYCHHLWISQSDYFFVDVLGAKPNNLFLQSNGDLGEKLIDCLAKELDKNKAVIFIGSDCPFIDADYLLKAIENLCNNDVVLGPASDGGYVLIGLKKFLPRLFENILWGSSKVLHQTLSIAQAEGLYVYQLEEKDDIDRPEDLLKLREIDIFL